MVRFVLSAHTLVIAAIFIPYVVMMGGLFAYIIHTGREKPRSDDDDPEPALP